MKNDAGEARLPPPRGRHVLVVDDNRDGAVALATLVERLGYEAVAVHNGEAALAAARLRKPDVVLLDIGMPGMDGYELARQLRAQGCMAKLVVVSGFGVPTDKTARAGAAIACHYLKPISIDVVREVLS